MQSSPAVTDAEVPPEAVIAGTLCLMSFFGQTRCPHAARKIVHNLGLLTEHPALSAPFRDICENLTHHWRRSCALGARS